MTLLHSALVVVDVQRDFCPGGALAAEGGERILPALNRHLDRAHAEGMPIYATRDWHPEITSHFKAFGGEWPPHCVQGTAGAEFHPGLHLTPATIVVSKGMDPDHPGYSAFDGRTADGGAFVDDLRTRGIGRLFVTGIATDYCVQADRAGCAARGIRGDRTARRGDRDRRSGRATSSGRLTEMISGRRQADRERRAV